MGGPTPIPPRKEWRPGERAEQELYETPEAGSLDDENLEVSLPPTKSEEKERADEQHLFETGEKTTRRR